MGRRQRREKQEDSVRLFVNKEAWEMAVQWSFLAPSVFSRFKMLKAVSFAKSRPYIKR